MGVRKVEARQTVGRYEPGQPSGASRMSDTTEQDRAAERPLRERAHRLAYLLDLMTGSRVGDFRGMKQGSREWNRTRLEIHPRTLAHPTNLPLDAADASGYE